MKYTELIETANKIVQELNTDKLKVMFGNIPSKEMEVYLDFIKNLEYLHLRIENIELENEELKKYFIIYLSLYNLARAAIENFDEIQFKTLELIKELEGNLKNNVLKAYILFNIYLILQDKLTTSYKLPRLILKYADEMGGFEISMWGIKAKWDLLFEIFNKISKEDISRFEKKYKNLTKDSFLSFLNL